MGSPVIDGGMLISDAECRTISNMDARVERDTNAALHGDLKLEVTGGPFPNCDDARGGIS